MPVTITSTITKKTDRTPELEALFSALDGATVRIGFEGQHEGGLSNAQLGHIMEHGSPAGNIPARPAVGPGIAEANESLSAAVDSAVRKAAAADRGRKQALTAGLEEVGEVAVQAVKDKIYQNDFVPLAPATVEQKGHSQAWIDTHELINSLSSEVDIKSSRRRRVKL